MTLKQRDFLHDAANRSVVWIDPREVSTTIGSKWPVGQERLRRLSRILPSPAVALLRPGIKRKEPFVIPREVFAAPVPIDETRRYLHIADIIAHRSDVTKSAWHGDLIAALNTTGIARYKTIEMRSTDEITAFFEGYLLPMIDSLEREGYRADTGGYESTAVIGPEGEVIKTGSGVHRFCVARILGLQRFPLKIVGAHEDWVRRAVGDAPSFEKVIAALPALSAVAGERQ